MDVETIQRGLEDMDMVDGPGAFNRSAPPPVPAESRKLLDLVFIQDATGSQGSYISSATKNIEEICASIFASGKLVYPEDLRIGLIAFRDHPPQDHTYITKNFGFTSDVKKVHENLKSLYASGGGDGPEAVTAALGDALDMDWRSDASKMVVLIADAPPHGIGEYGDGFDEGSPDGRDPLVLARLMAQRGITLFFVACEPALSGYQNATDFYQALTTITSGLMIPLTTANLLAHAIVGSVLENLDMERLVREVGQAVAERIFGGNESVDDVARELHERLLLRGDNMKKVVVENIYRESEEATHNMQVWSSAPNLQAARPLLKKVKGSRFTDKYLQVRYSTRPGLASRAPPILPSIKAASPPRKVVSTFNTFDATPVPGHKMFGSPVAPKPTFGGTGPVTGASSFGGLRGRDMDDEDDEDDGQQRIELRDGAISLDQARRIAIAGAWRMRA